MNKTLLISIALFSYLWYRKKDSNIILDDSIPDSWLVPSYDSEYILFAGTIPYENDVMQYKVPIMKVADIYNIEAAVIAGMICKESGGIANKINGRFIGLMQFGLQEAKTMGYKGNAQSLLDPTTDIYWGTTYLNYCIKQQGNLEKGISGYNSGNVEGHPSFQSDYVDMVSLYASRFRFLLAQSFPGYPTIFPRETWLRGEIVSTV